MAETFLVEYEGNIWEATRIKGKWRLKHPIPKWVYSDEFVDRFVKEIFGCREKSESAVISQSS